MTNFKLSRQAWDAINDIDEALDAIEEGNMETIESNIRLARQKMVVVGNDLRYNREIRKSGRFFHDDL